MAGELAKTRGSIDLHRVIMLLYKKFIMIVWTYGLA